MLQCLKKKLYLQKKTMRQIQEELFLVEESFLKQIEKVVNDYFGLELRSKCQESRYITARLSFVVLAYNNGFTFQRIGKFLKYANHCQPRYFYNQYNEIKGIYPKYEEDIKVLMKLVSEIQ